VTRRRLSATGLLLCLCTLAGCVGPGLEPPGRRGAQGSPDVPAMSGDFGNSGGTGDNDQSAGNGNGSGGGGTTGPVANPGSANGDDAGTDDDAGATH
jgi:hypothetical protein